MKKLEIQPVGPYKLKKKEKPNKSCQQDQNLLDNKCSVLAKYYRTNCNISSSLCWEQQNLRGKSGVQPHQVITMYTPTTPPPHPQGVVRDGRIQSQDIDPILPAGQSQERDGVDLGLLPLSSS